MMGWVRLDDQFADHPKVVAAGPLAAWMYVCALTYSARLLTDGFVPVGQIRKLTDVKNAQKLADKLVEVGLFVALENGSGYIIHDYLEYNPSRSKTIALREERAKAGERGGKQKASNLLARSQEVGSAGLETISSKTLPPSPTPSPTPELRPPRESERQPIGIVASANGANGHGTAPPRRAGNLVAFPETFEIRDVDAEWVRQQHMPIAWVKNRTESFVMQFDNSSDLKSMEAWYDRWRKWILDDWNRDAKVAQGVRR